MPEGPECRRLADEINCWLGGQVSASDLRIVSGRYLRKSIPGPSPFSSGVTQTLFQVGVKGKLIWWDLGPSVTLLNTLGMTGTWHTEGIGKHTRAVLETSKGQLLFDDMRNFGTFKFVEPIELEKRLKQLGPDALIDDDPAEFIRRARKSSERSLAGILLDQSILAGVGNYLRADARWLARLSPFRTVFSTSDEQLVELYECARSVAHSSYESGGSTIRSYSGLDGLSGRYSRLAYGRNTGADGLRIISRVSPDDGRMIWWAPERQK